MNTHFKPSRRDLLKGGGALVVSFSLAGTIDEALAQGAAARQAAGARPRSIPFSPSTPRARSRVYSGKVDLGTGVAHRAGADRRRRARRAVRRASRSCRATRRSRPTRARPGAASPSRSAACRSARRRRPRESALLDEAAKRLGVKPEELKVADGVVTRRRQERQLRRADRRQDAFRIKLDHDQAGADQGPEGLQDRRQVGAARRHPGQGDRHVHLHAGLPRARHAARRAWCGRRRSARKLESVDEGSIKGIPGIVKVVREGNFLGVVAAERMGRDQGARRSSRRPGRNGKACPSRPSCASTCARPRSPRTR